MSEMDFETRMRSIAQRMKYPHTPDIAGRVMSRIIPVTKPRFIPKGWAWSLTIVVVLLFSLLLIPPVRAAVLEFIQVGIVRIFPRPTETLPLETPRTATPQSSAPVTATPSSSDLIPVLSQLAGETTLSEARQMVDYTILLPTYPLDVGLPDLVFVQDVDGAMTILVWLDSDDPKKVLMSLHFIPNGSWAVEKIEPTTIQETIINGNRAVWTTGPYPIYFSNGDVRFERLISGHVLIWPGLDVTSRLETSLPLEEAIKIAESLEPVP